MKKGIVVTSALVVVLLGSCHQDKTNQISSSNKQTETEMQASPETTQTTSKVEKDSIDPAKATENATPSESKITAEMAYEGVNNYCHKTYDWSIAEKNPSIMYVQMGEETESEYQVIFRSYTGAYVYFYVNKTSGTTRIVEHVPSLDLEEEAGTIELFDYLEKKS